MVMKEFNLEEFLSDGVENTVKSIAKVSLLHPQAGKFMMQHIMESKQARKKRADAEKNGRHIPPFLIASITNRCNLHCRGCYSRANNACVDGDCASGVLSAEDWNDIFCQAGDIGVEFILLAGGEPFVRKDVLSAAAKNRRILFPIFTNGTMMDEAALDLMEQSRNLMPVISIEGDEKLTDERRGAGVYSKLRAAMRELNKRGILFGASVTVSKGNMKEVLSESFIAGLEEAGAKAVVFVEYVPVNKDAEAALDDADRADMAGRIKALRNSVGRMLLISFPGDEEECGGCLAAGRGFFHINAYGGAEPCPFSPYSDSNVKDSGLLGALQSPLFTKLKQNGNLAQEHTGGCTLFQQQKQVRELLSEVTE